MPTDEVIACPACRHLVRVPADWLGTQVQCPQCQAFFRAPVRQDDGSLSESVLVSDRAAAPVVESRRRIDWLLLLPAFGLMLCGAAGTAVNTRLFIRFLQDPAAAKQHLIASFDFAHGMGVGAEEEPDPKKRKDLEEDRAARNVATLTWAMGGFASLSLIVFLGGLAIATRRGYSLAVLGCVLAMLNVAHGCCFPGLVFGVWGLLLLLTPEGRGHFKVNAV